MGKNACRGQWANGGHLRNVCYCPEILHFEFIVSHIINKPDIPAYQTVSVN